MQSSRGLFLVAAMLGALSGCTPSVQLRTATLRSASPEGPQFDAVLAVKNTNPFDVQVRMVRASVTVGENPMRIPVQFDSGVWIRAHQTAYVAVPVTVPWGMTPTLALSTLSPKPVPFRIVGEADVTATNTFRIERNAYEFDEEGELPRNVFVRQQVGGIFPITLGVGRP